MMTAIHPPGRPTTGSRATALVLGLTALLTLIVTAFAWPASEIAPRKVPVAVVGPAPAVAALQSGTTALGDDALGLRPFASRPAAVAAINERAVSAAIVLDPDGTELLTASAGSPAVAQLVQQFATHLSAGQPTLGPVVTTDVVPLPSADNRGLVFNSGSLPIVLGGILTGALTALRLRSRGMAVLAALGAAVTGAMAIVGVLQGWLGALNGSYWTNTGVVALGIAAVALTVLGLRRLIGPAAVVVTALTMVLLGNPLSGVTSAPELLPAGWSTLGQLLPPGATGSALRSAAFFDGAGAGPSLLVLTAWALVGAGLALVPTSSNRRAREPQARDRNLLNA